MERARSHAAHTWSEYVRLPEDDRRELVDGALVEVDVPKKWHERIVAELVWHLQSWARTRKRIVLASGYKLRIGPRVGAMPDIQVLTEATYRAADEDGLADGRPELVVEVVSPRSRAHDRVRKLRWYASIGVPEYWIVDPRQRTLDRLVLQDGAYDIGQTCEGDETFRPHGMRGLSIPLADLWKAVPVTTRRKRR